MTDRSLNHVTVLSGMTCNHSSNFVTQIAQVIGQMFKLLGIGLQCSSLESRLLLRHACIALIRLHMYLRHRLHCCQYTLE